MTCVPSLQVKKRINTRHLIAKEEKGPRTPSGRVQLVILRVRQRGLVAVAALPQVLLPQLPARNVAVFHLDPDLGLGRGDLFAVLFFFFLVVQTLGVAVGAALLEPVQSGPSGRGTLFVDIIF